METLDALRSYVHFLREREGIRSVRLSRNAQRGLALLTGHTPEAGNPSSSSENALRKISLENLKSQLPQGSSSGISSMPPVSRTASNIIPVGKAGPLFSPLIEDSPLEVQGSSKAEQLRHLGERASVCVKCPHLAAHRHTVVFGVGNPEARIMFVGEAPGEEEDLQGEPFVGRAGQLLTKMIAAMGLSREQVYIANILKCRPDMPPGSTGNRKPTKAEMDTCLPYLRAQIDVIQPAVMIALGATAIEGLLGPVGPIGKLRGSFLQYRSIPLMPTFHPSYLLRNQSNTEKRKVWEDLLQVMAHVEMVVSDKQRGYFLSK